MRSRPRAAGVLIRATALASISVGVMGSPAWAHGDVAVGDHELVIGFGTEPAYQGFPNSAQVVIRDHDGEPVRAIDGRLEVEVRYGDTSETLPLEPNFVPGDFGEEGDYRAWFVPSRAGEYTFRVFGELEGKKVEEELTSGPKTFSDVLDTSAESFPVQDPTTGEIAERLEREIPRMTAAIAAAEDAADDAASSARTIAIVAVIVGVLGLILGAVALTRTRREHR